jgi:Fur family peroxide stress response transcriptional regulator
MQHMKEELNNRGLKATPQRLSLIELLKAHGHLSIDAIYENLKPLSPSLSLSTVYNNLAALSQKGVVREVAISGSRQVYELARHEHAHLVCTGCGDISDLPVDRAQLHAAAMLPKGAQIERSDLIFSGLCPVCVAAKEQAAAEACVTA